MIQKGIRMLCILLIMQSEGHSRFTSVNKPVKSLLNTCNCSEIINLYAH